MKDVMYLMEKTCIPYYKKFILCILCLGIAEACWGVMQKTNTLTQGYDNIFQWGMIFGYFLILWLQIRRFQELVKGGGFVRIQLLPLKKSSFLYSEIIFTLSMLALVVSIQLFVWMLSIVLNSNTIQFVSNTWMMETYINTNVSWIPRTITEVAAFFSILVFVSYLQVIFYSMFVNIEKRGYVLFTVVGIIISLPLFYILLYIINLNTIIQTKYYETLGVVSFVGILILQYYLYRVFLIRRRCHK